MMKSKSLVQFSWEWLFLNVKVSYKNIILISKYTLIPKKECRYNILFSKNLNFQGQNNFLQELSVQIKSAFQTEKE